MHLYPIGLILISINSANTADTAVISSVSTDPEHDQVWLNISDDFYNLTHIPADTRLFALQAKHGLQPSRKEN